MASPIDEISSMRGGVCYVARPTTSSPLPRENCAFIGDCLPRSSLRGYHD